MMDTTSIVQEAKDYLLAHKSLYPELHIQFQDGEQTSISFRDFPTFKGFQNIILFQHGVYVGQTYREREITHLCWVGQGGTVSMSEHGTEVPRMLVVVDLIVNVEASFPLRQTARCIEVIEQGETLDLLPGSTVVPMPCDGQGVLEHFFAGFESTKISSKDLRRAKKAAKKQIKKMRKAEKR